MHSRFYVDKKCKVEQAELYAARIYDLLPFLTGAFVTAHVKTVYTINHAL